jgi:hypothetical protein
MATRAAACMYIYIIETKPIRFFLLLLVSSKVRALNDFYNNIATGITPLPSGFDIANAVKYFSQALLG